LILDTNALSAIADGEPTATGQLTQGHEVSIPVIVLGEFRYGIARSRYRRQYEDWLSDFLLVVQVIEVSEETTRHYASIRVELRESGTPLPANDLWIAALCRQYGRPILSRDRHFDVVNKLHRVEW
jgi:tRNA(fMet)-specific endonuclease VapC